jgi:lysyl-tRNA synthetase class 2
LIRVPGSTWAAAKPEPLSTDWRPGASPSLLRARAEMLEKVRGFFRECNVLEVETPLLCQAPVTDPSIEPLSVAGRYLQTSPEYAMKRLLAAGSGAIFQVCKAFRGGESGTLHNPEFSLLEWYRPGFDQKQLMNEVRSLVELFLPGRSWSSVSYRDVFLSSVEVDPWLASEAELEACARQALEVDFPEASRDEWLDLLMSHLLQPQLASAGMVFVYDYPPSQAALARVRQERDICVSERFELFADGIELANAYVELTDPGELAVRFATDNAVLESRGESARMVDQRLLDAVEAGLPECSGVALGLDRLLMLSTGCGSIEEVLAFDWKRS